MDVYFAHEDFVSDLRSEIGQSATELSERLFLTEATGRQSIWAQQQFSDCELIGYSSIGDAAKKIRQWGKDNGCKRWTTLSGNAHRRTQLVLDQLPALKSQEIKFEKFLSTEALGGFALLDQQRLLVSKKVHVAAPDGKFRFQETKAAPSRAYLKLWDLFTYHQPAPARGSVCLDLGSCPGGWTWVLASLGAKVVSVDTAPLDPKVAAMPGVRSLSKDAFSLRPSDIEGHIDWLFSDIICAPPRVLELVNAWLPSGKVRNFACTVKFKGETDTGTLAQLLAIPGSRAVHLYHNKHEVTWILSAKSESRN